MFTFSDCSSKGAPGRDWTSEVSRPLKIGRHEASRTGAGHRAQALQTELKKSAVAAAVYMRYRHWTGEVAAKLVFPQLRLWDANVGEVVGGCVEQVVADELEERPVEPVASALRHHVDDASGEPAILRGEIPTSPS